MQICIAWLTHMSAFWFTLKFSQFFQLACEFTYCLKGGRILHVNFIILLVVQVSKVLLDLFLFFCFFLQDAVLRRNQLTKFGLQMEKKKHRPSWIFPGLMFYLAQIGLTRVLVVPRTKP